MSEADWKAPSLGDFETMAAAAYADLPENFRALCGHLIIQVDDFPTEEVAREMELESEFDLLGLFHGTGLAQQPDRYSGQMPNLIWLYRRPILDYWAEHDETLGAVITHVLVHEIGHHFGLSDDDIDRIEGRS